MVPVTYIQKALLRISLYHILVKVFYDETGPDRFIRQASTGGHFQTQFVGEHVLKPCVSDYRVRIKMVLQGLTRQMQIALIVLYTMPNAVSY